jgi:nucleotide-binding universal stress UspA family protein
MDSAMRNIVVAVDFSPVSDDVVRTASEIARATGAHLHLLHVAPPEPAFVGFDVGPQSVRDAEARRLSDEHRRLSDLDRRLEAEGLRVTSSMWRGDAAEKILDLCARVSADLLCIGSRGRPALVEALLGGVASALLRRSRCPVVVSPAR